MPNVITNKLCSGCGACIITCPMKALKLGQDIDGFYKPETNNMDCNNCGKCLKICPFNNPTYKNSKNPQCWAFNGKPEIEHLSATAGGFQVIAKEFIARGGKVVGCAWGKDMQANHLLIDNMEDLPKLYKSKYVQSFMGNIYEQIKLELDKGTLILFSGAGCHVAGLYASLDKDYKNLYTIDILCHYMPSTKLFKNFLDEKYGKDNIAQFDFRAKTNNPNDENFYYYYYCKDGTSGFETHEQNTFCKAYHQGIFKGIHCKNCKFGVLPRQGDLSLGDFHRLNILDNRFKPLRQEGALINNKKGELLFDIIKKTAPIYVKKELSQFADKNAIDLNGPRKGNFIRNRVFELAQTMSTSKAIEYTLNNKYDIGLISFLNASNYGSVLVNNAIYQTLKNMGKSILMIEAAGRVYPNLKGLNRHPELYSDNDIALDYNASYLNNICDSFMLGSDQLLNLTLYDKFKQLSGLRWVVGNKKKSIFGLSFGPHEENVKRYEKTNTPALLHYDLSKFDVICTRGTGESRTLKNYFNINAQYEIIDPTFLMTKEYYTNLCSTEKQNQGKILFAYILDISPEKEKIINEVAQKLNLQIVIIGDGEKSENQQISITKFLSYFRDAEMILTDSFHGTCFSVIFNKAYYTIGEILRGKERFNVFDCLGIKDRQKQTLEEIMKTIEDWYKIDYPSINKKITQEREKMLKALKDCIRPLNTPKILSDREIAMIDMHWRIFELEQKINEALKK